MKLTVHMLIKNEERWIWFALKSIENLCDRIIIFDTGSTDKTIEIIKTFIKESKTQKVELYRKPIKDRIDLVKRRQEMVEMTKTEWFLLVDGDEVWEEKNLQKLISELDNAPKNIIGAVVRTRNCVGDIFHYQNENAGNYRLKGKVGHLTIRAYRKDKSYSWRGEYPLEGYMNQKNELLNNQDDKLIFVDIFYYHLTHLKRSDKTNSSKVIDRLKKFKLEIGLKAKNEEIPKVFYDLRPEMVESPFTGYSFKEYLLAFLLTPIRNLKRYLA